jgi:hypothetical protein
MREETSNNCSNNLKREANGIVRRSLRRIGQAVTGISSRRTECGIPFLVMLAENEEEEEERLIIIIILMREHEDEISVVLPE